MISRTFASIFALMLTLSAQDPTDKKAPPAPPAAVQQPASSHFIQLAYPRDRNRTVALADGLPITLEDLCRHIEQRHQPGFCLFLSGPEDKGTPEGARILTSDLIAPWVRQLADITALQAEAKTRGFEQNAADAAISAALKGGFEEFLGHYVDDLKARNLPTELSTSRVNCLLVDYQLRLGLSCELQGWLDFLEPERAWTEPQLNQFFQSDPRIFGGAVHISQILVKQRDAGTGILLNDEGIGRALARLTEIETRLAKDGSNFEEMARLFSEESRSAPEGGVLHNVERFDYRLPAAICREAWRMRDGQVSSVIETQYGWHLVMRIEQVQQKFMLFTPGAYPVVRLLKKKLAQENLLFAARERHKIELKL
ncbi:MAG: peptidylprolyl isomerase [Planctomycetota bacterium]|nr:peptidylprolyl isomerase [Planctomycetota bacterium]MSR39424.1 hypothetical protein [Planctomycetota bacterium]